jgi:hypothetical protein
LECALQPDGALVCTWYHPTAYGRDEISHQLRGPDGSLVSGFRRARPGDTGGRVRITANGRVITNRQLQNGDWVSMYVGQIDRSEWADWSMWIERERR